MIAFTALIFPFLTGFLLIRLLLARTPLFNTNFLSLLLALPTGLGIISLLFFACYGLDAKNSSLWLFSTLIFLVVWLLIKNVSIAAKPLEISRIKPVHLDVRLTVIRLTCLVIFLYALGVYLKTFFSLTSLAPFGEGDARFFWNVKAKFYLREPLAWKAMFSEIIAWSHPDYPLLLPGSVAWGWLWTGRELTAWPILTALLFSLSTAALAIWHLSTSKNVETGLAAGGLILSIDFFRLWSAAQYADIPVGFFFLAAGIFLMAALRTGACHLFFLTGLMTGFSVWTKNEGLFFFGWILLTALCYRFRKWSSEQESRKELLGLLSGALPGILAAFVLKSGFAVHGDYIASGRTVLDYFRLLFQSPENTKRIFEALPIYTFKAPQWHHLWSLGCLAIVVNGIKTLKSKRLDETWVLPLLSFLTLTGYIAVIHLTPNPIVWQIQTALTRLLLQIAPLVLVFTFDILAPKSLTPSLLKVNMS